MVTIRPERGPVDDSASAAHAPSTRRAVRESRTSRRDKPSRRMRPGTSEEVLAPVLQPFSPAAGSPPAPSAPARRGTVRALPTRPMIGPIPVAALVGLELLALAGLLLWKVRTGWGLAAAVALGVVGVLLLVPVRGMPLGGRLARRLSFLARRRVGAGEAAHARVRVARDHAGQALGVVELAPLVSALIRVHPRRGSGLHLDRDRRLPLARLAQRIAASGIPCDSITVLGELPSGAPGAPHGIAPDEVVIVVRLAPTAAQDAVTIRGGDATGVDACMSALAGLVVSTMRESGLDAELLRPDEAQTLIGDALAGADDRDDAGASAWTEGWPELTTGSTSHRTLAVTGLSPQSDLTALQPPAATSTVAAVRVAPAADGPALARVLLRVSDAQVSSTAAAAASLAASAHACGLRTTTLDGAHRGAYLDTTVLGSGPAPSARRHLRPDAGPWLPLSLESVDRLAPVLRSGGTPLGPRVTPQGREGEVCVDLVGPSARRLLAVGDGWLPAALAARAAAQGVRVVVVTDHPAPWSVLARQSGVEDRLSTVVTGTDTWSASSDPTLVVVEGEQTDAVIPRRPWQSTLLVRATAEQVEPDLFRTAALTLLSPSALSSPEQLAPSLGVPSGELARLLTGGIHDVLIVEDGRAVAVHLAPA